MAKEIGIDQTNTRQCAFCNEPFDSAQYKSYMLKGSSQKIQCTKCANTNYFIKPDELSLADQIRPLRAIVYIYILSFLLFLTLCTTLINFKFIEMSQGLFWLFLLCTALIAIYLSSLYKKNHRWKLFDIEKTNPKEDPVIRQCAFCQESFDSPEFWNYMLQPYAHKIKCIRCENTSYFVRPDTSSTTRKIAYFVLLFVSILPFPIALMLMNKYKVFKGPEHMIIILYAFLIAFILAMLSNKFYTWNFSAVKKTK